MLVEPRDHPSFAGWPRLIHASSMQANKLSVQTCIQMATVSEKRGGHQQQHRTYRTLYPVVGRYPAYNIPLVRLQDTHCVDLVTFNTVL